MPNKGREKPSRSQAARSQVDPEASSCTRAFPGEKKGSKGSKRPRHAAITSSLVRKVLLASGLNLPCGMQEDTVAIFTVTGRVSKIIRAQKVLTGNNHRFISHMPIAIIGREFHIHHSAGSRTIWIEPLASVTGSGLSASRG
jgi:hypothetical protein